MLKNGPKDYLNILSFPRVNKTIFKINFDAPKRTICKYSD